MKPEQIQFYLWLSLSAVMTVTACFVLLYLAQFAEFAPPPQQLPLEVIFFLGVLFTGLVFPFLNRRSHRVSIIVTLAVSSGHAWLLTGLNIPSPIGGESLQGSLAYGLAPVVALAISLFMKSSFPKRAELWVTMLVYVVCTILANYTLDSFIPVPINLPEWLPLSFEGKINVGTLFFGIIFTQRDRIHQFGRKYAYLTIALAAVANILVSLRLDTPLRFVLVSFIAIVLSETADTEVYQRFIKRRWITRVAASNALSIPIDSTIFTVFAFLGESFATPQWMLEVIITDITVKLLVSLAAVRIVRKQGNPIAAQMSSPS